MATFHFKAMDSAGETQTDQMQAANAAEAMDMLRARGLFVVAISELAKGSDKPDSAESSATAAHSLASDNDCVGASRTLQGRGFPAFVAVFGLALTVFGLYGVVDAVWFSIWGDSVNGIVVDFRQDSEGRTDILEFTVAGRQIRTDSRGAFGWLWGHSLHRRGTQIPVLYAPDHPQNARLAAFGPRYGIPLSVLVFGLIVTFAGVFALRYGWRPA